jgi:23S rRNA (adenine2503-C2)-methyltransferase
VPQVVSRQVSLDGTRKYLMRIAGGHEVEVVYIPEEDRGTLCISSQVGCTLTCSFCHTGTQKLVRNLTAGEIIGQVMVARDDLDEWPRPGEGSGERPRLISNIVLMGMGEPLYNFEKRARRDENRHGRRGDRHLASAHHVVDLWCSARDRAHAEEIGCMLAVSFHATTDEVRDRLVPINKRWNIAVLLDALRAYPKASNSERITFEYVMLKGVNDSDEDARRSGQADRGHPGQDQPDPVQRMARRALRTVGLGADRGFADIVYKAGYASPIRTPRGEDIMAACGQLKSATERARKTRAEIAAETGLRS